MKMHSETKKELGNLGRNLGKKLVENANNCTEGLCRALGAPTSEEMPSPPRQLAFDGKDAPPAASLPTAPTATESTAEEVATSNGVVGSSEAEVEEALAPAATTAGTMATNPFNFLGATSTTEFEPVFSFQSPALAATAVANAAVKPYEARRAFTGAALKTQSGKKRRRP